MSVTTTSSRATLRIVAVVLCGLLLAGWLGYSFATRTTLSSAGDVVAVVHGRELHLPFSLGGGSARTVTITINESGCLGVDGISAVWPHGVVVHLADGAPVLEYAGKSYSPGDQIDINALPKPVAAGSIESVFFKVPSACGRTLAVVRPGFSAAG